MTTIPMGAVNMPAKPAKPVFTIPKCKVTYVKSLNVSVLFAPVGMYTGPRYRVELVDGHTAYWAGEYPPAEFDAAIATAHRVAKRAQTVRYDNVSKLLKDMEQNKE